MSSDPKDGLTADSSFEGVLDDQFSALELDVDGEAKSDAATSVHAWKDKAERERLAIQVKDLKESVRHQAATRKMRKSYAREAIGLARAAVMFWVGMFFVVGFWNALSGRVPFSDQALVTLTAGATVNVLAAFIGIIRGLFPAGITGKPEKTKGGDE